LHTRLQTVLFSKREKKSFPTVIVDPQLPVSRKLPKRGFCLVGITIDENGIPSNVRLVRSLEPELDTYAMEAAKNWRFRPALRDGGAPVAVEGTVVANFRDVDKESTASAIFVPESPEKAGAAIDRHGQERLSVEIVNGDEVFARYAPRRRIPGHCLVSLVVNGNGAPHNVHIVKGIDSGLDMDTAAMIEHSQFKVTMPDGENPAEVGLIISVHYSNQVAWRDLIADILPFVI
jgi:TonB family protein